jgi:hypothetical protein
VNNIILAIVAVGEDYIEPANEVIDKLSDKWDIHVLTDNPKKINWSDCFVELQDNKIFSYFDKMLFVLRLVEEYKTGVLYIDVDRVFEHSERFLNDFINTNQVTILNYWPEGKDFKPLYSAGKHFVPFVKYCNNNDLDYDIDTFSEELFYIPYMSDISKIIYDVEKVKPLFEYQSLISRETNMYYPNIGNAEGLALSYALKKNKHTIRKYER